MIITLPVGVTGRTGHIPVRSILYVLAPEGADPDHAAIVLSSGAELVFEAGRLAEVLEALRVGEGVGEGQPTQLPAGPAEPEPGQPVQLPLPLRSHGTTRTSSHAVTRKK